MRCFRLLSVLLASASMAACATLPASFEYPADSNQALLVAGSQPGDWVGAIWLRRVNLETYEFEDYNFWVDLNPEISQTRIYQGPDVELLVSEVEPGAYVAIGAVGTRAVGLTTQRLQGCITVSGIFEFAPGEIVITDLGLTYDAGFRWTPLPEDLDLESLFAEARLDYPGIVGEAVLREPDTYVQWQMSESLSWATGVAGCSDHLESFVPFEKDVGAK